MIEKNKNLIKIGTTNESTDSPGPGWLGFVLPAHLLPPVGSAHPATSLSAQCSLLAMVHASWNEKKKWL